MNRFRYAMTSLLFFWRIHLAVSCGVIAATAVLTGALLVGDSMRGSLRKISLDGLGSIDEILIPERFFRDKMADDLESSKEFESDFEMAETMILFPNASASLKSADQTSVANKVTLIGCKNNFWNFSGSTVQGKSEENQLPDFDNLSRSATTTPIVLNEPLATDLGITKSDLDSEVRPVLTVRIPKPQLINADNPIGKKDDLYETIARLEVCKIIPAEGLGRFNLHPSQILPRIVFLPMSVVQEALQKEGLANALIVSAKKKGRRQGTTPEQSKKLNSLLEPSARDLGLIFKEVQRTYQDQGKTKTVFQYTSLSSDQLLLTDQVVKVAMKAYEAYEPQEVLTYLANGLKPSQSLSEQIPFSMVAAIDLTERFQLISAISGQPIRSLKDDEIVINSWSAEDLIKTSGNRTDFDNADRLTVEMKKLVGKKLRLTFYEPEASHGKLIPRFREFAIADIAKVIPPKKPFSRRRAAEFDQPPTLANDPDLTPFVPGVTDQNSVNKWDLPFKTQVRPQDDDYWQFYRTTPKAFVNLVTGQELWQSRFGKVTSLRIHSAVVPLAELEKKFLDQAKQETNSLGFLFNPIKRRNLQASSGSTPFDVLFLALSFFIIAAALILISLLFRLGVDQKVAQLGLLSAVGWSRVQISRMLAWEGVLISLTGGVVGIVFGVVYAKLMVYGLTTWWVGAVMTNFMEFHWSMQSILVGFGTSVLVSVLTIRFSLNRVMDRSVRDMLAGQTETQATPVGQASKKLPWISLSLFVVSLVLLIVAATSLGGEAQAGAFMGGGAMLLSALLIQVLLKFKQPRPGFHGVSGSRLAFQNASRNPLRSTLTIGLVASATFMIVAVSSFHLTPTQEGTGGFEWIAESSRPLVGDLQDPLIREDLLGESLEDLKGLEIYSIRYLPGDEAGCNNPFQAQRPKVLGVTDALIDLFSSSQKGVGGFAWGGSIATTEAEKKNPWELLRAEPEDGTIPVVIDKNTAMYSLKIFGLGGEYEVEFSGGKRVKFRVVGFLSNSTLQGSLVIAEKHFEKLFPNVTGYRTFLIRNVSPVSAPKSNIAKLETELANYGFDATQSITALSEFLAVQNTYLSTFQTLGAFGLFLGTFGLATVQMRNVVERRKELALMQALGFSKNRLSWIVMAEHSVLLVTGMFSGIICALFSVAPHVLVGDVSVPFLMLGVVLFLILVVGLISGLAAVFLSFNTPLLLALRQEN
jgi:putative ABC transport system permease protein